MRSNDETLRRRLREGMVIPAHPLALDAGPGASAEQSHWTSCRRVAVSLRNGRGPAVGSAGSARTRLPEAAPAVTG